MRKSSSNVPTGAVNSKMPAQVKYFDGAIHQVRLVSLRYFFSCSVSLIFINRKEEEGIESGIN